MATNLNGGSGAPGKTILNGNSAPSTSVGLNGDFYINTSSQQIYGPKSASAWGSATSLIGDAGAPGITTIDYKGAYVSTSTYQPGNFVVHSSQTYIATNSSTNSTPPASSWDSFPFVMTTGAIGTDSIWDAKGDLVVGTGADTASRLSAGPDGRVLVTASAEITGLKWDVPVSGGNTTSTTSYSARPSAAVSGNLFFPDDGFYIQRDTSSTWASWGPIYKFTAPDNTVFTDVNIGSAVVTASNGGIHLQCASNGSAQSVRLRAKTLAASSNYTVQFCFQPLLHYAAFSHAMVGLRDSATDDAVFFTIKNDSTTLNFGLETWNSNTSGVTGSYIAAQGANMMPFPLIWIQFQDDGANRITSWSNNGIFWNQLHTVGRTNLLTPDQLCFGVNPFNQPAGITLLSLKEF